MIHLTARLRGLTLGGALSILLLLFLPRQLQAAPLADPYLFELQEQARQKKLGENPYWRALLHYRFHLWGGEKSEADGRGFFNAKNGKHDAAAELQATLEAFFSADIDLARESDKNLQHPQCRHRGRFFWLAKELAFDPQRLKFQKCERFDNWQAAVRPESVTLVFASYYLNNPASMFGHTLLRFNHPRQGESVNLLDYAVNYAAEAGTDGGLAFMFSGLFGGYRGTFSHTPYYFKVQDYSQIKKRDIWEYDLNFTPSEIERLLAHLWELGSTHFDYFFFDENCSYHLLTLLEVARPSLHLRTARFWLFAAPSETVKEVLRAPQLASGSHYRASRFSLLQDQYDQLNEAERDLFFGYRRSHQLADEVWPKLSLESQVRLLDALLLQRDIQSADLPEGDLAALENRDWGQLLNLERSKLGPSPTVVHRERSTAPELGHGAWRLGLAGGTNLADADDSFTALRLRPAYHDLLGRSAGYLPQSHINVADLELRYQLERREVRLQQLDLVQITSLTPLSRLLRKPSWDLSFGVRTLEAPLCHQCNAGYLEGGGGLTLQAPVLATPTGFLLANVFVEGSGSLEDYFRFGPKAIGGLLLGGELPVGALFTGTIDSSPFLGESYFWRLAAALRLSFSRNSELRLELSREREREEALAALQFYF